MHESIKIFDGEVVDIPRITHAVIGFSLGLSAMYFNLAMDREYTGLPRNKAILMWFKKHLSEKGVRYRRRFFLCAIGFLLWSFGGGIILNMAG